MAPKLGGIGQLDNRKCSFAMLFALAEDGLGRNWGTSQLDLLLVPRKLGLLIGDSLHHFIRKLFEQQVSLLADGHVVLPRHHVLVLLPPSRKPTQALRANLEGQNLGFPLLGVVPSVFVGEGVAHDLPSEVGFFRGLPFPMHFVPLRKASKKAFQQNFWRTPKKKGLVILPLIEEVSPSVDLPIPFREQPITSGQLHGVGIDHTPAGHRAGTQRAGRRGGYTYIAHVGLRTRRNQIGKAHRRV